MGETIPKETNYVNLDKDKKDEWGMPLINFSVDYDDNDEKMIKDFMEQYTEMYKRQDLRILRHPTANRRPAWIFMKWVVCGWEGSKNIFAE